MDAEWKQKWVEALRSEKYKQGKKRLRTKGEGFCCLGVLCDIYDPSGWEKYSGVYEYRYCDDSLPASVRAHVGLDSDALHTLVDMNDGYYKQGPRGGNVRVPGVSFSEIADYIEKNL